MLFSLTFYVNFIFRDVKIILFIFDKNIIIMSKKLSLDFYIPSLSLGIECQGIQHFKPRDFAYKGDEWAKELYNKIVDRDNRKNNLCTKNGVKILYVTDCDMEVIENSENKPLYENIIRDVNVLKNILQ